MTRNQHPHRRAPPPESQTQTFQPSSFSSDMSLPGLDRLGRATNVLTVADLSLRYGAQVVRNVAPVRRVVFSDDESRQLMDVIRQCIKKADDLLVQDNGLSSAEVSQCRVKLSGYHLSLANEESLLNSTHDPRIEQFRRTENLSTNFDRQEQRKRLELLSGCTERFYVEVLSRSQTARAKHAAALKCPRFEDEDEVPVMNSPNVIDKLTSWVWTKLSLGVTTPADIEANSATDTPRSDSDELATNPPQEPLELSVDAVEVDVQMLEGSSNGKIPCRVSMTFELPGVSYVIQDPQIKTLEDARAFCSPQSAMAMRAVGMVLVNGKILPRGSHKIAYNSLSGTYDIPEERMMGPEID
ncbi:unnamed protein product [Rhizoctonia solani]|uniref:Uncharacterized protein n=1 Tax=Rhizoctonia solani TaxID=456999 RepID=A0A8H3GJL9_9AGAM|nr:unnamed protein product [Rhizoctonia solani]